MNITTSSRKASAVVAVALLVAAMCCFQLGASIAKGLFPVVGAAGTTALRTGLAAVLLVLLWRPWRMSLSSAQARNILLYGASVGMMNLTFYGSIKFVPLGIGVALAFTGPLAVAVAGSRRPIDFLWVALAALGLLALLPIRASANGVAPVGVLLALISGACWALYIIYGRRASGGHSGQTTALGMLVAAVLTVPLGFAESGLKLVSLPILAAGLGLAVLSGALPYSLEMIAMPRLPAKTVGVLMSLDPVVAAIVGLFVLGEQLTLLQWAALACIVTASAGSTATHAPLPN